MVDAEKTMTRRGRNSRCVFVATKTILLCARWLQSLKKQAKDYERIFKVKIDLKELSRLNSTIKDTSAT